MDPFTLGFVLVVVAILLGVRVAARHRSSDVDSGRPHLRDADSAKADSKVRMPDPPEYVEALEDLDKLKSSTHWADIRG